MYLHPLELLHGHDTRLSLKCRNDKLLVRPDFKKTFLARAFRTRANETRLGMYSLGPCSDLLFLGGFSGSYILIIELYEPVGLLGRRVFGWGLGECIRGLTV